MHLRRRLLVLGAAGALAPLVALAQATGRVLRIGIVADGTEAARNPYFRGMLKRLAELGYVEGKNLAVAARYSGAASEQLSVLAAEIVAMKPDVIIAPSTPSALAAKQATSTIPIVMIGPADPIASGLIAGFARPGGNITGVTGMYVELGTKWIDIMRELVPGVKRIAYLSDGNSKGSAITFAQIEAQARPFNISVLFLDGRQRAALERSLDTFVRERGDGLIVGAAFPLLEHRGRIVEFAAQRKLPVIYSRREYLGEGGLLFYGVDNIQMYVRAAEYVQRIAQGAKPAELPVDRPSAVRMIVNLKTARAQGIKIPQRLLVRADEVIE